MGSEPHEIDTKLVSTVDALGYTYVRREGFKVTDDAALNEAGLMRLTPDWKQIRKLRDKGEDVPGVVYTGIEYVIRQKQP